MVEAKKPSRGSKRKHRKNKKLVSSFSSASDLDDDEYFELDDDPEI